MLPQVDVSGQRRPLKRPRSHSVDECNSGGPRLTKRHQQRLSTTPTTSYLLNKVSPPNRLQTNPPTPPESSRFSRKCKFEDNKSVPDTPNKRRIEAWLHQDSRSRRNSYPYKLELKNPDPDKGQWTFARRDSCPPQLGIIDPDTDKGQRQLLEVLQEMSQIESQKQDFGLGSVMSTESRPSTSHPNYRKILRSNGVCIDHNGMKIPKELRSFLDLHIFKERSSKLSAEAVDKAVKTAIRITDSPEVNVYDFADTAMLPIKRPDIGRSGNTPWHPDGLPRNEVYPLLLAVPKANIHLGYPTNHTSDWTVKENAVMVHPVAKRLTQPAIGNCFPFFAFELKSEAMGGNLWQAENQVGGSGACCVNAARWLYQEAYPSEVRPIVDSIAFSACVTHRLVVFHVHFYIPEENQHYMSWIAAYDPLRQVQESNHLVKNIIEHCLGERQTKIRKALALLYPFPGHWKNSRPASVMDSQFSAADEYDTSDKSQRTK